MRLDKYLKVSRLIKRRTVANEACDNARISVNGKPAKASYDVKVGDQIEIAFGARTLRVEVLAVAEAVRKTTPPPCTRKSESYFPRPRRILDYPASGGGCDMTPTQPNALEAPHQLQLDSRARLHMTGVIEVESFDESTIVLTTTRGTLIVRGEGLHLQLLRLDGGEVLVDGTVDALTYEDSQPAGSFLARLFG